MLEVPGDLHLHSCLSPCADITMVPGEVSRRLVDRGIRVAALTDHNSACNTGVFERVFRRNGILLVPGIEVTTAEEVHLLCYFETMSALWLFGRRLYASYPHVAGDPERFGYQLICNERDEYVGQFPFLLSMASPMTLDQVKALTEELGGVVVPSHVDRRWGLLSQLGVVTPALRFATYEIAHKANIGKMLPQLPGHPQIISSSDAHNLDSIGPARFSLAIGQVSTGEVLMALRHEQGREVRLL